MTKLLVFAAFAAIAVTAVSGNMDNMGQGNGPQGKAPPVNGNNNGNGQGVRNNNGNGQGVGNNNGNGQGVGNNNGNGHGAAGGMKMSPWSCSAVCTETDGALSASCDMSDEGSNMTVHSENATMKKQCDASKSLITRGYNTSAVTVACPAMACRKFCSAEGVNVTAKGTFHCFNRTNLMAPTAVKANDKAIALGCYGNHAMGNMFMAGINHTSCASDDGTSHGSNGQAPVRGRPDTTGMSKGDAAKAKKEAAEKKKEEANEKKAAAAAKKAEAAKKREEAKAKKAARDEKKAKAQKTRDNMVANITDVKAKLKATMAANAAIAGASIKKVKANFTAANETAACDNAFAAMNLNSSLGVCDVSNGTSSRRRARALLADSSYSVEVLLSEAEVDTATINAALDALSAANITADTVTEDALAVLATVDGIDNATLTTMSGEATAAAAAAAEAAAAESAAAVLETEAATLQTEADTLATEATTLETEATEAAALVSPPPPPTPVPTKSPPKSPPPYVAVASPPPIVSGAAAIRTVVAVVAASLALFMLA